MPEPRWRDVDLKTGKCAHCDGTHYGTGMECPYREENMGEPCILCGERTNYCCSDCAVDGAGKVYVCITDACRAGHEKKHAKPLQEDLRKADAEDLIAASDLIRHFDGDRDEDNASALNCEQTNAIADLCRRMAIRIGWDEVTKSIKPISQ